MPTRISVTVKGPIGLDEPDQMLADLTRETDLPWEQHTVDDGDVLSVGLVDIILVAVVTKSAEMTLQATVDGVKKVVKRWRAARLDPPETVIDTEELPDDRSDR
ncbi:hypothetical protein [Actinophytocola sp.]|uniref:hypothetical protein n=1 Tax=Actinophytocola sp. TaxID=1872138 RepID=UPI002D272D77|nr:hypothetical protein [Actinophytocola sp.]HYQ68046.1 hypothetical protein [Actinophytocola sp.]